MAAASLTSAFAGMQLSSRTSFAHTRLVCTPVRLPRVAPQPLSIEAAHKKGAGSTKNGRDSVSKRRGVKVYGGQAVKAGGIIIRQLGNKVHAGEGVGTGKDFTLFALQEGIVVFKANARRKTVTVVPADLYEVPEGQRPKEGSRAQRNREFHYARRAAARAAKEAAAVAQ